MRARATRGRSSATQAIPAGVAHEATQILQTVVAYGTGKAAAIPASPPARPARRRTTATPGSSASTDDLTVAVWVGYPDRLVPMLTRVRRRAGRRRHLPGGAVARLHDAGDRRSSTSARPTPKRCAGGQDDPGTGDGQHQPRADGSRRRRRRDDDAGADRTTREPEATGQTGGRAAAATRRRRAADGGASAGGGATRRPTARRRRRRWRRRREPDAARRRRRRWRWRCGLRRGAAAPSGWRPRDRGPRPRDVAGCRARRSARAARRPS